MKRIRNAFSSCRFSLLVVFCLAGTTSPAWAASGHGEASISDLTIYYINFVLFFGGLFLLLRKPLGRAWAARSDSIATLVNQGRVERQEAEKALQVAKTKLEELPAHLSALEEEVQKETTAEVGLIEEAAKKRVERIREQTGINAEAERLSAEKELQAELAEKVIQAAKERIRKELSAEKDKKLRDAAIAGFGRMVQ